jgi:CubicO group peptidase (beta-lactamase class C family)
MPTSRSTWHSARPNLFAPTTEVRALTLVSTWPVGHVAAAVVRVPADASRTSVDATRLSESIGDTERVYRIASLSKPIAAWAVMVAVEEGIVELDGAISGVEVVEGATLRHLLAHAGGYSFDGNGPVAPVAQRRIYSNFGIELAAAAVSAAAEMTFEAYLSEAVLGPLGMPATALVGSAANGISSTVDDMVRFVAEMLTPTLLAPETVAEIVRPQFPDLAGIVPGVGRFDPCPWGLGVELRGKKSPHWTGIANSSATFGHFGSSGSMMWVDPAITAGAVALTDRDFGEWSGDAMRLWPEFSDAIVSERRLDSIGSPT